MRVLDTYTGEFVNIHPRDDKTKYAILSHTWDAKEQTYQELVDLQMRYQRRAHRWWRITQLAVTHPSSKLKRRMHGNDNSSSTPTLSQPFKLHDSTSAAPEPIIPASTSSRIPPSQPLLSPIWSDSKLSPKIREACRIARENGYRYLWIDSCCIDKTSSSELSESINSMYEWYASADVCYAFLPDVPAEEDHGRGGSRFRGSRWFTRGWTLQELIAPVDVRFLSMEWIFIGSKESLARLVAEITNISYSALLHLQPLDEFGVAQRLSWAAKRETTRLEDRAYSLLGIFDINMPTLYGEGRRALRRLQEEIMRRTPDQSLFAWTGFGILDRAQPHENDSGYPDAHRHMKVWDSFTPFFAPSLVFFEHCSRIEALSHDEVAARLQIQPKDLPERYYHFTPYGIRMQLPVFSISGYFLPDQIHNETDIPISQWYFVILGCEHKNFPGHLLARVCYLQTSGSSITFLHSGWIDDGVDVELLPLSPAAIIRLQSSSQISMKTLYIPQLERDSGAHLVALRKRHERIKLVLPEKTRQALSAQGYQCTTSLVRSLNAGRSPSHLITLSHNTHTITIDYQHTLGEDEEEPSGQQLTIEAYVNLWARGPDRQETTSTDAGGPLVPELPLFGTRISWQSRIKWSTHFPVKEVVLNVPGESTSELTIRLGLTFATMNHYFLRIELKMGAPS